MCTISSSSPHEPPPPEHTSHIHRLPCDFSSRTEICFTHIVCCQNAGVRRKKQNNRCPSHSNLNDFTEQMRRRGGGGWTARVYLCVGTMTTPVATALGGGPLCVVSWYTEREWQGLKNWQTVLAGRLPWGLGTFGIMCECRGVWMKNSCVILPCCFCQECVIFPLSLSLSLPPSHRSLSSSSSAPQSLLFSLTPRFSSSLF